MKILKHNATTALFEKVKSLSDAPGSWRCIYLHLSDRVGTNAGLRTHFIVNTLGEQLSDTDGTIYLCDDGDIFILFQGAVTPVIKRLAEHFEDMQPKQLLLHSTDDIFTVFDLSRYWDLFFRLCQAKTKQLMPNYRKPEPVFPAA